MLDLLYSERHSCKQSFHSQRPPTVSPSLCMELQYMYSSYQCSISSSNRMATYIYQELAKTRQKDNLVCVTPSIPFSSFIPKPGKVFCTYQAPTVKRDHKQKWSELAQVHFALHVVHDNLSGQGDYQRGTANPVVEGQTYPCTCIVFFFQETLPAQVGKKNGRKNHTHIHQVVVAC